MTVEHLMQRNVATCSPETPLTNVAELMRQQDCGSIPVVNSEGRGQIVGIVTDRDIVLRAVARGIVADNLCAKDCMTTDVKTVLATSEITDAMKLMETHQVRRIPVVDADGCCIGIVAQADVARKCEPVEVAKTISDISEPARAEAKTS